MRSSETDFFSKWADAKGPASPECDRLGQLFGRAIDASKSGESVSIPAYLQKPPVVDNNNTDFVWHRLERKAVAFKAGYLKEALCRRPMSAGRLNAEDITMEFVQDLFKDDIR